MGMPQGYYVYAYLDGNEPFYIGKGLGNRAWYHLHPRSRDTGTPFYQILEAKIQAGWETNILIIKDGLEEREAYEIEAILIELVGTRLNSTGPLYNAAGGLVRVCPVNPANKVICWGEEFPNLRAVAEDARSCVTYEELKGRRRGWSFIERPWNLEEAVSFPIYSPTLYHFWGDTFLGLEAVTNDTRCPVALETIRRRRQKGWPLKRAIFTPNGRVITCWGEAFPNLRAIANDSRCVVTYRQLQKRTYHRGCKPHWDVERAATTPIDPRYNRKRIPLDNTPSV